MNVTQAMIHNLKALEKAGIDIRDIFSRGPVEFSQFYKWDAGLRNVSGRVLNKLCPIMEEEANRLNVQLPYIISQQATDVYAVFLNRLVKDGVLLQDAARQALAGYYPAVQGADSNASLGSSA